MVINEEEEGARIEELPSEEPQSDSDLLTHIGDNEIIQLKNNSFPKGMVPLEEMFDKNDVVDGEFSKRLRLWAMESILDQKLRFQLNWFLYSFGRKGRVSRAYQNFCQFVV